MLTPQQVIDTYFLEARHMLLEIAALLDRHDAAVERAGGAAGNDKATGDAAGLTVLRDALRILAGPAPGRERTVELLERFAKV